MPRRLPWASENVKATSSSAASSPARPHRPTPLQPSRIANLYDGLPAPSSPRGKDVARARTPSTSPPPAPPEVKFMVEGFADGGDDRWMMVEDEFLSTARLFTQHIHHAEYVRLKKLAQTRSARRTNGEMQGGDAATMLASDGKIELAGLAREQSRRIKSSGERDVFGESSDEDEEKAMDPQLAGLMSESQRHGRDLSRLTKIKSQTRAAAGFPQSPHKPQKTKDVFQKSAVRRSPPAQTDSDDDDTEDDLDLISVGPTRASEASPLSTTAIRHSPGATPTLSKSSRKGHQQLETPEQTFSVTKTRTVSREESITKSLQAEVQCSSTKFTPRTADRHELSHSPRTPVADYLAQRRAARAQREQKSTSKARLDEVPTFLI